MSDEYMRKKEASNKYDISLQTIKVWVKNGLVSTAYDGLLVNANDIEKAMTRKKIKSGRPYGKNK